MCDLFGQPVQLYNRRLISIDLFEYASESIVLNGLRESLQTIVKYKILAHIQSKKKLPNFLKNC